MAEETKREKFRIIIDRHPEFPKHYCGYYIKSSDLCKLFSDVFREVYSDWEGCRLDFVGGMPTITAFFNQRCEQKDGLVAGTSIYQSKQNSGSDVVNRRRHMDEAQTHGDRFFLTEEGKDGLEKFVLPQKVSRKTGQVDWKNIVIPASPNQPVQGSPMNMFNRVQYTQVGWLDPNKILTEIYGVRNEDGMPLEYVVSVVKNLSALPQGFAAMPNLNSGWLLRIDQLNANELNEVARKLGYMVTDDLGIIR